MIGLDGVIDDQVHRDERLDDLGILPHPGGHATHGGQVGQQRHAGEVLQHDPGKDEGNFVGTRGVGFPVGQLLDVLLGHLLAVAVAQHRLEYDADGNGETGNLGADGLFQCWQRVELAGLAGELEFLKRVVQVV